MDILSLEVYIILLCTRTIIYPNNIEVDISLRHSQILRNLLARTQQGIKTLEVTKLLTSIPASRDAPYNETNLRYFKFKRL